MLENVRFNPGEKKRRRGPRQGLCGAVRHLCHGRLRHRPPGPGLHPWRGKICAGGLRRTAAGGRVERPGTRRWQRRPGPWSPSSAAPRCPPSSRYWKPCPTRWTNWWWAAVSPIPSSAASGKPVGKSLCEHDLHSRGARLMSKTHIPLPSRCGDGQGVLPRPRRPVCKAADAVAR